MQHLLMMLLGSGSIALTPALRLHPGAKQSAAKNTTHGAAVRTDLQQWLLSKRNEYALFHPSICVLQRTGDAQYPVWGGVQRRLLHSKHNEG
jgi:hypothetical protein